MNDFTSRLHQVLKEEKEHGHVGYFVKLPKKLADQYPKDAYKDGDTSDPHITLLYVGLVPSKDIPKLKKIGKEIVAQHKKMECFVGGLAYFTSPDNEVAHSIVECKGLAKLNKALWDAALEAGIKVEHKFPEYTPHVTLSCGPKRDYDGPFPHGSFMVAEIELWAEDGRKLASFKLK
jgi:2'-5' RNA ligase